MPQSGSLVWYLFGVFVRSWKAIRSFVLFVRYTKEEVNLFGSIGKQRRRGSILNGEMALTPGLMGRTWGLGGLIKTR